MKPSEKKINDRFIEAMDYCMFHKIKGAVNGIAFCKMMDIQVSVPAKLKNYQRRLSIDEAIRFSLKFNISLNWLLLNKGSMHLSESAIDLKIKLKELIDKL